jgi:arsenate reductase
MEKPTVIFVCTGNCCRSQMAEGLMRAMCGDRVEVHSAGSHPAGYVHPLAIKVMDEAGIDIRNQRSKGLDEPGRKAIDHVVTVCDHAREACSSLRGRTATHHWPVEDPALVVWDEAQALAVAREVRDKLKDKLTALLREIEDNMETEP